MRRLYNLNMIDKESSYDNYVAAFGIGIFSSREKAEEVARKYLTEVKGFKDYEVTYQITEKKVIGVSDGALLTKVFVVNGWDENEELDEIDVVFSECFVSENDAKQELREMKKNYCRKEWCIIKYIIDRCYWEEGYIKYTEKETKALVEEIEALMDGE